MSRLVIALGGNSLGNTASEQLKAVKRTVKHIVDLVEMGHEIVITHGNGPQVGMIYNGMTLYSKENNTEQVPFAESGAMSQGYIGYHLQQCLINEFKKRNINKKVATVVTQVEVSRNDKAFENPTKPIGAFYTREEARELARKNNCLYKEDAGRGYRRVIASPEPHKIIELKTIENLIKDNNVVITCGGGGIPVVKTGSGYVGVDAVIDKDKTSALLARELNADKLIILTAVEKAYIKYNTEEQKGLDKITIKEAKKHIQEGEFAKGSMLPKIEACISFVNKNPEKEAVITSIDKVKTALNGETGTIIYKEEDMYRPNKEVKKKRPFSLTAFTIILILIYVLAIITHFLPEAKFVNEELVAGSGVVGATLPQTLLAPILGFTDAIDICVFILILGAFLKIVNASNAIETGIQVLIKKLHGKELILIAVLMFLFSIGGTTYGMLEETVGFYAILSVAMVAAGMDTIVASAVVLLGAGSGVLGSTVNPFAVGVAIDAANSVLPAGTEINQLAIIGIGVVLWLTSYLISMLFVTNYAKKVIKKKGSTFLSLQEQKDMKEHYGDSKIDKNTTLTGKQKLTLILFGLTFIVMIIGFIPWEDFGVTFFANTTGFLTGVPLGQWYFQESTLWFLLMTILIGVINGMGEHKLVDTFIDGADDMVGVILIVALARGASVLMTQTYLDNYIIYNAANVLQNVPKGVFAPFNYVLHVALSVLVPSSSGLATLSAPIIAPLANSVGYSVEATIMGMVAANGLVNLFTPTCGAIMGGLALAKVEYTTWLRWAGKVILTIAIANLVILTIAMLIL